MSKPLKVLIPPGWREPLEYRAAQAGLNVEWVQYDNDHLGPFPGAEVFVRGGPVRRWDEALDNAPDVKWMHTPSAGVEHIRLLTEPRGLMLTESGRAYRVCISEFVIAQMFFVAKRLGLLWERSLARQWQGTGMDDLAGKTVGIIGLGPIGLGVAERAAALGMKVIGCRRSGEPIEAVTDVVTPDDLAALLSRSDYVVIACPLTEQTAGLIDAAALAHMKPTAWIFNIARGKVIVTEALLAALREGRLAGACLDVTDPEPLPADHPLWDLPNVFITPHTCSGNTPHMRDTLSDVFIENLQRYLAGQPLLDQVQYERGY